MFENNKMVIPKIVAEIGCNHKGSIAIAKEMITTAKMFCQSYAIKLQKRNPSELLSEKEYNIPHPVASNSYGKTYGAHREALEFSIDQHRELKEFCESIGIVYSCSVWDITSAKEIISLNPEFIKVPSACNLNKNLLKVLCNEYSGEIHISLGMTKKNEEESIIKLFDQEKRNKDLVIYSCTSGYPVPFEDVCLLEIKRLREKFGGSVKAIGFSGHHLGIAVDLGAFFLGTEWIERHFTLDRTWKGTDHAASLEPDGLRKLNRNISALSKSLKFKNIDILEIEDTQRTKLKENQIKWSR